MRVIRAAMGVWLGLGLACAAQEPYATDPLIRGRLVIWVVQPILQTQTADQIRSTLRTQTAGSFGRAASTVGRNAGDTGQSASSLGRPTTAGAASDVGQTAGSFGRTLSTLSEPPAPATPGFEPAVMGRAAQELAGALRRSFPELQLSFIAVSAADLPDRMSAVGSGAEAPDVVLGDTPALTRQGRLRTPTIASLGTNAFEEPPSSVPGMGEVMRWAILLRAPHPEEARAFVVWWRDGRRARAERGTVERGAETPAAVAAHAAASVIGGSPVGADADPRLAQFSPPAAAWLALQPPSAEAANGLQYKVDVLGAAANERFAVVALRVIAAGPASFGVVHPFAVLRQVSDDRWRVLHLSANLWTDPLYEGFGLLHGYAGPGGADRVKAVRAVRLAAPADNDTRVRLPELWWDNPGDASLLAVEWQTRAGNSWSDPHLYFVPDNGSHLQVRTTASFASVPAAYRWRVWSVGTGGALNLSDWRRLTVLP